jgi:hypothetical protein
VRAFVGKKGENWQKRQNCVSLKGSKTDPKKETTDSMTPPSVHIQISSEEIPSIPCWFGEVAIVAHCFTTSGLLTAIEQQVRLVRPRFGTYEVLDFVVVLLGYAMSAEPTLLTFYERLTPFAVPFMALFNREKLPHRTTLSRFLAALDQPCVEALRGLFQDDLITQTAQTFPPGGLWDRLGQHWLVMDIDGTKQAARQRALPQTPELPAPHRRFDQVCAPGYLGRKRGEVARTRTTVLQAHSHHWLGTFGGPGNGDYRGELARACEAIIGYAGWLCLSLSAILVRLDGLYGNGVVISDLLQSGLGVIVRSKDYGLLDQPAVQARLQLPPSETVTHPESGACRTLFDCPGILLTPTGPRVRLIIATHPATSPKKPSIGVIRAETVYELFLTTAPSPAFTTADVLDLYLHRGSFETVLADEDREQDLDRWCSRTPCGQEFCQILQQWLWNRRLAFGQQLTPSAMRLTEFAPALVAPVIEVTPVVEAAPVVEASLVVKGVSYGPPHWARRSWTSGFAGADFSLQPDGTLLCPAGQSLSVDERRPEASGSLRVLYRARLCDCGPCLLKAQCQESLTTLKPRRVSAVFWPITFAPLVSAELLLHPVDESLPLLEPPPPPPQIPPPEPALFPVLWGDWERCQIRLRWIRLLRTQTVDLTGGSVTFEKKEAQEETLDAAVQTRAQRAQYRLSWQQRMARNARLSSSSPLEVTLHGLPAAFAESIGLDVVTAA